MNETKPARPTPKQSYEDVMRELGGFNTEHIFVDEMPDRLRDEVAIDEDEAAARIELLGSNLPALDFDPLTVPDTRSLQRLWQEDWQGVETHATPLLALWSKARLRTVEHKLKVREDTQAWIGLPARTHEQESLDRLRLKALPLVHGTSFEILKKIMQTGQLLSNRALDKAEEGAGNHGSTYLADRELGLDQFVFADFGRRHMHRMHHAQAEVTLLISPRAMFKPGAIITEKDRADCLEMSDYVKGLSLPEDFYETALARIRSSDLVDKLQGEGAEYDHGIEVIRFEEGADADPAFPNGPQFSTWEVKMPNVSTEYVSKIIFRNREQYQEFVDQFGDERAVLEPNLGKGVTKYNKELLQETLRDHIEADYAGRLKLLEAATTTEDTFVIIDKSKVKTDVPINMFDPDLISDTEYYLSLEAAQHGVNRLRQPEDPFMQSSANSNPVVIARVKQGDNGARVIMDHEWYD